MIDNVYENIKDAHDYIEKAEVNLREEKKKHKSNKKVHRSCKIENVLHNIYRNRYHRNYCGAHSADRCE